MTLQLSLLFTVQCSVLEICCMQNEDKIMASGLRLPPLEKINKAYRGDILQSLLLQMYTSIRVIKTWETILDGNKTNESQRGIQLFLRNFHKKAC